MTHDDGDDDGRTMRSYLRMKVGKVDMTFEGSEDFMARILPKLVTDIGDRVCAIRESSRHNTDPDAAEKEMRISLPEFIRQQVDTTQVRRFLAAAAWLQVHQSHSLTSSIVVQELQAAKQNGVGNASDCLNSNINKGFCERRKDKTFFVTPAGLKEVGIDGNV